MSKKPFETLPLTQDIAENDNTRFDVLGAFQKALKTSKLGRTGLYCSTLPSTQTLLRETFDSGRTGMICIVDRQSKGLGRGGNTWESPHGCCMWQYFIASRTCRTALAIHALLIEKCHNNESQVKGSSPLGRFISRGVPPPWD